VTAEQEPKEGGLLPDVVRTRQGAELLFSAKEVDDAIATMALQAAELLRDKNPVLVSVMVGGQFLGARLASRMPFPMEMDYIHATRYRGGLRGKTLEWRALPAITPRGRTILVVDDILDEGITLHEIIKWFDSAGAASVHTAVLVEKDRSRAVEVSADIVGLHVPDRYVFGCGMDYKGYWRNLDGIYAVEES